MLEKKLFDLLLGESNRHVDIFLFTFIDTYSSRFYLIKYIHKPFNLKLGFFFCKKMHLRSLHVFFLSKKINKEQVK